MARDQNEVHSGVDPRLPELVRRLEDDSRLKERFLSDPTSVLRESGFTADSPFGEQLDELSMPTRDCTGPRIIVDPGPGAN